MVGKYILSENTAMSMGEDHELEEEFKGQDEILVLLMGVDDNDYEGGVAKTKKNENRR